MAEDLSNPEYRKFKRAEIADKSLLTVREILKDKANDHQIRTGTETSAELLEGPDGKPHPAFILRHKLKGYFILAVVGAFTYTEEDMRRTDCNRANVPELPYYGD